MSWPFLAMTLGMVAGDSVAGKQLELPLPPDSDFIPLARFSDGSWIGRVYTQEGVHRVFRKLPREGKKALTTSFDHIQKNLDWCFVFMRNGLILSVLFVSPNRIDRLPIHDKPQWNAWLEARLVGMEGSRAIAKDAIQRGAWLWWVYDVLNAEGWTPAERWVEMGTKRQGLWSAPVRVLSKLNVPVLVAKPEYDQIHQRAKKIEQGIAKGDPRSYLRAATSRVILALLKARMLFDEESGINHGSFLVSYAADGIRMLPCSNIQTPVGVSRYIGIVDGKWVVAHDPQFEDRITSSSSLMKVLADGDLILDQHRFDDWLDAHIVEGELTFDPEPFDLLETPDPVLMDTSAFTQWLRGAS